MPEPVAPEPTEPQAPAEPKNKGVSDEELSQLRKELEKAQMRANQLQNEAETRDKAEQEARRKQLEEQEEYKQLYEKTELELKTIREREESAARSKVLSDATDSVLKDYPKEVVDIAATTGIGLTDDSEAARTSLKEKLDAIKERVAPATQTPSPTNPYNPAPINPDRTALVTVNPEIGGSPMAYEAAKGNLRPTFDYIGGLSAIKEMKRQAGLQP